jgi:putative SbcD/Mre11-related phosphoesterase
MAIEPVPGAPAATADTDGERLLVVADYHAGIEVGLQREGVEVRNHGPDRIDRLLGLLAETDPDRLVILGDLAHAIGDPWYDERDELKDLLEAVCERVPVTLVKGNHDGDAEALLRDFGVDVDVTPTTGIRIDGIGFAHGHTWPAPEVLEAEIVCVGHEHPQVRLEDAVGGRRHERVWLRGGLDPSPFETQHDRELSTEAELVVFPAFNHLSGGTWVNVDGQEFLAPFLPEGLSEAEAYLLDGTRLGPYGRI